MSSARYEINSSGIAPEENCIFSTGFFLKIATCFSLKYVKLDDVFL